MQEAVKIPADQLDSLVAPIAIYPDNLLSQTLVASTYPLEIVQLQQWLERNPDLAKDQNKLAEAVKKQPWDPSIQAMAALPDLVKRLSDDIQWTTDLGNAFLAQQSDVMDAVQRMRQKAKDTGALESNQQQVVETKVIESKEVIVIEQASPEVVYVPSYEPDRCLWRACLSVSADLLPALDRRCDCGERDLFRCWFGHGRGLGWRCWGWGCGWGGSDINVNMNNNFNRNTNIQGGNRTNVSGNRGGGTSGNTIPRIVAARRMVIEILRTGLAAAREEIR